VGGRAAHSDAGEHVITSGAMKRYVGGGLFTHDQRGAIMGVDLAGRLFNRIPTPSP
jgi:hypothetical protein